MQRGPDDIAFASWFADESIAHGGLARTDSLATVFGFVFFEIGSVVPFEGECVYDGLKLVVYNHEARAEGWITVVDGFECGADRGGRKVVLQLEDDLEKEGAMFLVAREEVSTHGARRVDILDDRGGKTTRIRTCLDELRICGKWGMGGFVLLLGRGSSHFRSGQEVAEDAFLEDGLGVEIQTTKRGDFGQPHCLHRVPAEGDEVAIIFYLIEIEVEDFGPGGAECCCDGVIHAYGGLREI